MQSTVDRTGHRPPWLVALLSSVLALAACTTASPTASPIASGTTAPPTASSALTSPTPAVEVEPDSASKIVAAEVAGTIDHDLALVYLLYAALDYNSLPTEYQSSNPTSPEATAVLAELSLRVPELSSDLQAKVAPFFLRPDDPSSVWAKRSAAQGRRDGGVVAAAFVAQADCSGGPFFACIDAPNTPIRLWYDISVEGAKEQANGLVAEIESSHMWSKEQTAMVGHTPCSDGALSHNGGDSRLDVYLVSTVAFAFDGRGTTLALPGNTAAGVAVAEAEDACGTIAFLALGSGQSAVDLKTTLAHELFHAFEFSFKEAKESSHRWWLEATAVWAEDLVYPVENTERHWLRGYWAGSDDPEGPLDTYVYSLPPQYAAYIWPFYLRQKVGSTNGSAIGDLWLASETDAPLVAISKLDKWPEKFKEFALWNWNKDDPELKKYRDNGDGGKELDPAVLYQLTACMTDNVCAKTTGGSQLSVLANGGPQTVPIKIDNVSVNYLAARPDVDVEKLTFDLSAVRGSPGIGLQALLYIGDADSPSDVKVEDWSELAKREICLNEEDVQKVVLVVSNSNIKAIDTFDGLVNVEGRSSGCSGWRGTMTATLTWDKPEGNGTSTTTFEGLWAEDAEYGKSRCYYPLDGECEVYYRADGTIKWTWDAHQHGFDYICNETTSGTVPTGLELHDDQQLFVIAPKPDAKFQYWGMGHISTFPEFKCMANVGEGWYAPPGFFDLLETASSSRPAGGGNTCGSMDFIVDAKADTISGSCYEFKYDYNALLIEWDLHRVGPPPGD